jgi:hypothetical protein
MLLHTVTIMKRITQSLLSVALVAVLSFGYSHQVAAQIPGDLLSAGVIGGAQSSSVDGIGMGSYFALRGGFSGFFGEMRMVNWGSDNSAYIHETGYLGGMDFSLLGLMLSGGVGLGSSSYQAPLTAGQTVASPVQNYTSFLYEAQAMYQFKIISDIVTAGAGVNYVGETAISGGVPPMNGWGAVASINIGL